MDIATLIGLVTGAGLVLWAIMSKTSIMTFVDGASFAIVVGGAFASILICFPLRSVLGAIKVLKKTFFAKTPSATALIEDMVKYAEVARRDGILALENVIADVKDPFIVSGIQMAVDGTDPAMVEQMLNSELDAVADRHADGKSIFESLGKYAPAFGMIGTLVGLVIMLGNMADPSSIGPAMAVALLTTLYGSMIANMFALPLADKLGLRSQEELLLKAIVIHGIMAIQSGDNPRIVEQKLKTFLPHKMRGMSEDEKAAA